MQNSILYMYFLKYCWAPHFYWGRNYCESEISYKEYLLKDYSKSCIEKANQTNCFLQGIEVSLQVFSTSALFMVFFLILSTRMSVVMQISVLKEVNWDHRINFHKQLNSHQSVMMFRLDILMNWITYKLMVCQKLKGHSPFISLYTL